MTGMVPSGRIWARSVFDTGQYRQAGEYLVKAHENMNPKDPELLFQAAGCFVMVKSPDKALKYLELLCGGPEQQVKTTWLQALEVGDLSESGP